MKEIDTTYSFFVTGTIDTDQRFIEGNFSSLPFTPDEMIVRQLSYAEGDSAATTAEDAVVTCDFSTSTLAIFAPPDAARVTINMPLKNRFILKHPFLCGIHRFNVIQYDNGGNITDNFVDGNLSLLLEFVKYKK